MLKIIGSSLILISCYILGISLSRKAEIVWVATRSMKNFVSHVSISIKTIRSPLKEIFASYSDPFFELYELKRLIPSFETEQALNVLKNKMTSAGFSAVKYLLENLGGIDIDEQCRICQFVESKLSLELEAINNTYKEKKRMYRLMPVLCGLSLIILFV